MTSAQKENGVSEVRWRLWDLKLFIFFVLNEKFYWKKNLFAIQERLQLKFFNTFSRKILVLMHFCPRSNRKRSYCGFIFIEDEDFENNFWKFQLLKTVCFIDRHKFTAFRKQVKFRSPGARDLTMFSPRGECIFAYPWDHALGLGIIKTAWQTCFFMSPNEYSTRKRKYAVIYVSYHKARLFELSIS